jgi:hypothetical protein
MIRLTIDELVVEGLRPGDRDTFAAALERELGRLFVREPLPAPDGARERVALDAGVVRLRHDASAGDAGIAVAGAIHRGIGSPRAGARVAGADAARPGAGVAGADASPGALR